jgi:hypothetical protein
MSTVCTIFMQLVLRSQVSKRLLVGYIDAKSALLSARRSIDPLGGPCYYKRATANADRRTLTE